jgi:hypothetical protein
MIPIHENYKNYRPPRYVLRTVTRLLADLPKNYLSGLQSVVLSDSAAVLRGETIRIRGRRTENKNCLGLYHRRHRGEQPWIEIIVDNVIRDWPRAVMWLPFVQDMVFSTTLYHEVGHHLDRTIGAPARGGEAAAEAWKDRLQRRTFEKRYWYLVPIARILRAMLRRFDSKAKPRSKRR